MTKLHGFAEEVEIVLDRMPARDDFLDFILFAKGIPGERIVRVLTPDGPVELPGTSGIGSKNIYTIKRIFRDEGY